MTRRIAALGVALEVGALGLISGPVNATGLGGQSALTSADADGQVIESAEQLPVLPPGSVAGRVELPEGGEARFAGPSGSTMSIEQEDEEAGGGLTVPDSKLAGSPPAEPLPVVVSAMAAGMSYEDAVREFEDMDGRHVTEAEALRLLGGDADTIAEDPDAAPTR